MISRKFVFAAIAFVAMSFDHSAGLTDAERKYASGLLQASGDRLLEKVKGLTPEQLNFRPDSASWSVAECIEHLAISENNLFGLVQTTLGQPADPSKRDRVTFSDDEVVKMVTDRSTRVKTAEAFEPSGRFGTFEATRAEFRSRRDNSIDYVTKTSDDLRNRYTDFPFGKVDAFQIFLFMAGHTTRHTEQIDEIMRHAHFPGK